MEIKATDKGNMLRADMLENANALQKEGGKAALKSLKGSKGGEYNVHLSGKAKEMSQAYSQIFDIAKATNPIRESRVADLKSRIEAGSYQPDSGDIADGILREAIKDHLARPER